MKNGSKKILIIVIIIILVLAISGTTLGYLFLATDTFKSAKELFYKYIGQNTNMLNTLLDSSISTTLDGIKQQEIYESETTINTVYSEGGEISNPINELSINLKRQKDNSYRYSEAKILFEDTEYLKLEGMRQDDIYGVRVTGLKQFLSMRDSQDLEQNANRIGIELENVEKCIEVINNDSSLMDLVITSEEREKLISKYINIISENLAKGSFTKQKNVMITYNNNTIKVNSYTNSLTSEQVKNLIMQVLNNVKTDETILKIVADQESFVHKIDNIIENLGIDQEIPEIKITVYEQDERTIRTVIEAGLEKYTIENINENNQNKMVLQRDVLNNEMQEQQIIEITKTTGEAQESYNIICNVIEGKENYKVEFNIEMTSNNGELNTTGSLKFTQGIITIEFLLENKINTTQIQEKLELAENENVVLSDLDDNTLNNVLNIVESGVPGIIQNRINELIGKLQLQDLLESFIKNLSGSTLGDGNTEEVPNENPDETENPNEGGTSEEQQMSQIEINKFNAKFEFYTGETVSSENVKILLDVVKLNLGNVEFIPVTNTENNEDTANTNQDNKEEQKETIKLIIEKDKENTELANQVLEKITDGKKYKVEITYKDSNGMIDYITINEITE